MFFFVQVAGKLEIRVVPKEHIEVVSKPPLPTQNGEVIHNGAPEPQSNKDNAQSQPKIKLERTKSILKQSSKERNENVDLPSPKRENITFAPEPELHRQSKKLIKRSSLDNDLEKQANKTIEKLKQSSDSSSSSKNEVKANSPVKFQLNKSQSDSRVSFNPELVTNTSKIVHKPIEKIKSAIVDSNTESSSSTQEKSDAKNQVEKRTSPLAKPSINEVRIAEKNERPPPPSTRIQCSPTVDLISKPAVSALVSSNAAMEPRYEIYSSFLFAIFNKTLIKCSSDTDMFCFSMHLIVISCLYRNYVFFNLPKSRQMLS